MATQHIGPVSVGSGDGTNWQQTCSWASFPSGLANAFARGDVLYFQDGIYQGGKSFTLAESGVIPVTIKKATASDHGSDTGWVTATMGSGFAVFDTPVRFTTRYWTGDIDLFQPTRIDKSSTIPFTQEYNTPAPVRQYAITAPYKIYGSDI